MYYKVIAFNNGGISGLGGLLGLRPDYRTFQGLKQEIALQKSFQDFVRITFKNTAGSGGLKDFVLFDTENASGITHHADISITCDFPGGYAKLCERLKAVGPLYFAGIGYEVSAESVFTNLALKSLRNAGQDVIQRSANTDLVASGKYNQVNIDPKQRYVAASGEMAYNTGLNGKLDSGQSIEFIFPIIPYEL